MFLKPIKPISLELVNKYSPQFKSRNVVYIDDETAIVEPGDIINVYGIGPCRGGVIKSGSTYIPFHHTRAAAANSAIASIKELCDANGVDMPTAKKIIVGDVPILQDEFESLNEEHSYAEELEILERDRNELVEILNQLNSPPGEVGCYFPNLKGLESKMNCYFSVIADTNTDDVAVIRSMVGESDSSLVAVGSLADSKNGIKAKSLKRISELAIYAR